jgi:hypothetical protein
MTIKQLKEIISNLSDETTIIISAEDIYTVETINVEYHSDGRQYLVLSNEE